MRKLVVMMLLAGFGAAMVAGCQASGKVDGDGAAVRVDGK